MATQLHHERIVHGDLRPARAILVTHGIYGTGANWRGIARKLHDARPDWAVELVDLRGHGRSAHGAPPNTVAACADDVRALVAELGDIAALAGHSFGGKVALATRALVPMQQTWVLDSSPSTRTGGDLENDVLRALAVMERLPRTWARRDDFVAAAVAQGQSPALAQWLAMNVVPDAHGELALRLDLAQMRELLADYHARDLWSALEDPRGGEVDVVIADRSAALGEADRARLAAAPPHVHVSHVDAGHWLHIDAPAAVVELLAARLPR
jgi:pimeloyl-ACP methyl ester carboxylesterase